MSEVKNSLPNTGNNWPVDSWTNLWNWLCAASGKDFLGAGASAVGSAGSSGVAVLNGAVIVGDIAAPALGTIKGAGNPVEGVTKAPVP